MKEKLRLAILEAYGIDIDKYEFKYRSSLNAYSINIGEYTIRITMADDISKETRLARLQWALDIKALKKTICEPVPAKNGELIVDVNIGKWQLSLTMYRTARGELLNPDDIRPMTLISAGDMLGTMHLISMNRDGNEVSYDIPTPDDIYEDRRKKIWSTISPDLRIRIAEIVSNASRLEKNPENYGVCYGEFDLHNIIVDTNNIHLFDFDRSIYAHYMYDIASFAVSILSAGYSLKRGAKDIIENTFIPWFRVGYSINKPCKEDTFDNIEYFMELRGVWLLINLLEKYQKEDLPELKVQIDFVSEILLGKDIYSGIDKVRKKYFK